MICNPTPLNMSICDAEKKVSTVYFGLQILIFIGAGLQIQPNSLLLNSLLLKHSCP